MVSLIVGTNSSLFPLLWFPVGFWAETPENRGNGMNEVTFQPRTAQTPTNGRGVIIIQGRFWVLAPVPGCNGPPRVRVQIDTVSPLSRSIHLLPWYAPLPMLDTHILSWWSLVAPIRSLAVYWEGCGSFVRSCEPSLPFLEFLSLGAQTWPSDPKSYPKYLHQAGLTPQSQP